MSKKKKVLIDYLQFLNKPTLDDDELTWFFNYLDPKTETTKRVQNKSKMLIEKKYKEIKKQLTEIKKAREPKIVTTTIVNKKNKRRFGDKGASNKLVKNEYLTQALELKIEGYHSLQIIEKLVQEYGVSESVARESAKAAYEELAKDINEEEIKLIIATHNERYDDLYRKFMELSSSKLGIKALKAKETVNGIGQDIFEVQINNFQTKDLIGYGINKLNNSEQKELFAILSRIFGTSGEKQLTITQ